MAARELIEWARVQLPRFTSGTGRVTGSFIPVLDHAGRDYFPLGGIFNAGWAQEPTVDQATKWFSERRLNGMVPARPGAQALSVDDVPRTAQWYFRLLCARTKFGRLAQSKFSEIFDTNEPPFFRNFLLIEVSPKDQAVVITCYAATGRVAHQTDPPVEDQVKLSFAGQLLGQL